MRGSTTVVAAMAPPGLDRLDVGCRASCTRHKARGFRAVVRYSTYRSFAPKCIAAEHFYSPHPVSIL